MTDKYIAWFKEIDKNDIALVGGKGANLGEMTKANFPVPPGFIVTSEAYQYFIKENKLQILISNILKTIDFRDPNQLNQVSLQIKKIIIKAKVPNDLTNLIIKSYEKLSDFLSPALVAVRSSATAEDLPGASFAGQQETFLNIKGEANVINAIRECWASLFTPRAIFYRQEKKFSHCKISIAVPVQKMIQSEKSGVMFTIDPITNDKNVIIIEAIYGLGEYIVQGKVTPDHYIVDKKSLKILSKQINLQETKFIKSGLTNIDKKVNKKQAKSQKITDDTIIKLAHLAKKLHQHYFFPQDIEWALEKNKIYITQTRPVTTINEKLKIKNEKLNLPVVKLPLILKGEPASPGLVSGYARIIYSAKDIKKIHKDEVLVTPMTTPDFVPVMKKVIAIVTDRGGQTSHAAIVSRELGVPCVVGTISGTKIIKSGQVITVNGSTGEIFKGGLNKSSSLLMEQSTNIIQPLLKSNIKTATKVYVNLGEPQLASEIAKKNVDGVGLLRAEFMISQIIGTHPKKLIQEKKESLFINKLTDGLVKFCEAFNPRPIVYRATDFKTNEYRNLRGGKEFEEQEENPLLGYRGCFRYISDEETFNLELEAIKKVRNKYHYKNLWLMIPYIHTPQEFIKVKKIIYSHGLNRSTTFKLWIMVEIPANVILLEDFIDAGIDGVSIGSNDLTMLMLGIDRDNENIASVFDEQNPAVLWALEKIITTCRKHKISCSICGQAPSKYPFLAEKLVKWGITSISVSPDVIDQVRNIIGQAENKLFK